MKNTVKQGTVSKAAAEERQAKSSTAAVRKPAQKKIPVRGRTTDAQPGGTTRKRQPKGSSIFSYQSADDKNVLAIIDAVRTGISYTDFDKMASKTPFSLAEWASYLQLSERTIQRNQKENKPFQPIQSEKIIELVMLYEYGIEVFGDKDNFNIWLTSRSVALGGRAPKELLDTKFGIDLVKDELGRIEHGVLA